MVWDAATAAAVEDRVGRRRRRVGRRWEGKE
jgi:hypothetical protein